MAVPTLYDWYTGWREGGVEGLEYRFGLAVLNMFRAMPEELAGGVSIISGYRSVAAQQELWDKKVAEVGEAAASKWVARPGKSNHNRGLAIDLQFNNDNARIWIHQNSQRFGLRFPMDHEDWHIEPMGLRDGSYVSSGRTFEEGYAIDGDLSGGLAQGDPDAYTDQLAPEVDNHDPDTQMMRLMEMMGNSTGADNLQVVRPGKMSEMHTGIDMEEPLA